MRVLVSALAAALAAAAPMSMAQPPASPAAGVPDAAAAAAAQPRIARGLLLLHEGRVFMAPCRDRSYLNVEDVSEGGSVLAALKAFGFAAGRNLYVELLAVQEGGLLRVSGLNFAHTTARCLGETANEEDWRAVGVDARWAAAAGGGALRVEREGAPELRVNYDAVASAGGQHRIEAPGVTLSFAPGLCRVADGTLLAGWRATLTPADGEALEGCAWER